MSIQKIDGLQVDFASYGRGQRAVLVDFIKAIYPLLQEINETIEAYNALEQSWGAWMVPSAYASQKGELLAAIRAKVKAMDDAQIDESLACCPDYFDKIQTRLFLELQREEAKLEEAMDIEGELSSVSLSELIATMHPEKANQLAGILANKQGFALQDALGALYQPGEAGKETFDAFLKVHTLSVLGGANSKNFRIINKYTRKVEVLKLDNRLGGIKTPEMYLRGTDVADVFAGVFADRRVLYRDEVNDTPVSRSLEVVEFCSGSDVATYGNELNDDVFKLANVASLYKNMADVLLKIQAEGCFFPDMKNSNWLVDANGRIRIADAKSVMFADGNGNISNPKIVLTQTFSKSAPEMKTKPRLIFSVDKAHAYMLAKGLYEYLAGESSEAIDASELSFSQAIFATEKGRAFKALIQATLKERPEERLSLAEVQERIVAIDPEYAQAEERHLYIVQQQCLAHLEVLEELAIARTDKKMEDFLKEKIALLEQDSPLQDYIQLEQSLRGMKDNIEVVSVGLKQEINRFKQQGMQKEAEVLEYLLCNMSLEERAAILQLDTPAMTQVLGILEAAEQVEPELPDKARFLHFLQEQREEMLLEQAVSRFEVLCAKIAKNSGVEKDTVLQEEMKRLGGSFKLRDFEQLNQDLEHRLAGFETQKRISEAKDTTDIFKRAISEGREDIDRDEDTFSPT